MVGEPSSSFRVVYNSDVSFIGTACCPFIFGSAWQQPHRF